MKCVKAFALFVTALVIFWIGAIVPHVLGVRVLACCEPGVQNVWWAPQWVVTIILFMILAFMAAFSNAYDCFNEED